jgi:hypothetical protein
LADWKALPDEGWEGWVGLGWGLGVVMQRRIDGEREKKETLQERNERIEGSEDDTAPRVTLHVCSSTAVPPILSILRYTDPARAAGSGGRVNSYLLLSQLLEPAAQQQTSQGGKGSKSY